MKFTTIQEMIDYYQVINSGRRMVADQIKEIEDSFSPLDEQTIHQFAKELRDKRHPDFERFCKRELCIFHQQSRRLNNPDREEPDVEKLSIKYVKKMVGFILTFSQNQEDYNEAKLEWQLNSVKNGKGIKCNMCKNADITIEYEIINKLNNRIFYIGCDCIINYMSLEMAENAVRLKKIRERLLRKGELKKNDILTLQESLKHVYRKNNNKSLTKSTTKSVTVHCSSVSNGGSEGLTITRTQLSNVFYRKNKKRIPEHGVIVFEYNKNKGIATINKRGVFIDLKEVRNLGMPEITMGHIMLNGEKIYVKIAIKEIYNTSKKEAVLLKKKLMKERNN